MLRTMALEFKENLSLKPCTVFRIGGPARFFVEVSNFDELQEALRFAAEKHIPFFILGAGSNILISDRGFGGLVIHMVKGGVEVFDTKLTATADIQMAQAVLKSAQAGLSGLEWGIGIPGTVGGSIRGNAGCFGGETAQVVESVRILEITNHKSQITNKAQSTKHKFQTRELTNKECQFGYRDSIFKRHPEWVIISATLKLQKGDPEEIQKNIKRIIVRRVEKQDIGTKSAGCIFKNIPWTRKDIMKEKLLAKFPDLAQFKDQPAIPASYLIDRAGLKQKRVGGVFVSPKHANYFVNEGGATAEEVVMLISIAKSVVRRKYGILLEEEIQYVGF